MSDPNRERWEREAWDAWVKIPAGDDFDSYEVGYLAACEKYAPRWVDAVTYRDWLELGWIKVGVYIGDNQESRYAMVPPAHGTPGGEK